MAYASRLPWHDKCVCENTDRLIWGVTSSNYESPATGGCIPRCNAGNSVGSTNRNDMEQTTRATASSPHRIVRTQALYEDGGPLRRMAHACISRAPRRDSRIPRILLNAGGVNKIGTGGRSGPRPRELSEHGKF